MTDKPKTFAGFWPRVGAWFIDSVLLGVLGYVIGWAAMDYVSPLGADGRYIGLVIGILYHGILGSGFGGGQTVGKRLLGIKVVGLNGKPLNLFVAFWRALFLVGPAMLNGWNFDLTDPVVVQVLSVVAITAVLGIGLAQVYLILFGWPARRLVHDLLSGSVVVYVETREVPAPKGAVHAGVASLLVLASLGLAIAGPSMLKTWWPQAEGMFAPEQRVADAVDKLPEVGAVSVEKSEFTLYSDGKQTTTHTLIVTARTGKWPVDTDPLLAKIGAETVKVYRFAPGQRLTVKIVNGFDIGIASYTNARSVPYATDCVTADVKCLQK
ncbi:RDD family protein [Asticcacaulis sp. AC402]|uniref:RDD family protein n=1 Tax=Asticcacaulis sp. AC402 TaxID=1282361 RepID=UPI00138AE9D2|nr:RDD family protein [Asticcacaulis sp. AC402]